jgi:hypothetical protein
MGAALGGQKTDSDLKGRKGFNMMLRKHSIALLFGLALMAVSALPASANVLHSATATANCQGYTLTAVAADLAIGKTYTIDYTFTVTCDGGAPVNIPGTLTFTATASTMTVTQSGSFLGGLHGSCLITGTASLQVDLNKKVPILINGVSTAMLNCSAGNQGCTPGYWKNHTDAWVGYTPTTLVSAVFSNAGPYAGDTLLQALHLKGGPGVDGAEQILLRAAVSALLNSTSVNYPLTTAEVINMTDNALATGDRATIISVAAELDALNNLGCPLS